MEVINIIDIDYVIIYHNNAIEFINYLEEISEYCEDNNVEPLYLRYKRNLYNTIKHLSDDTGGFLELLSESELTAMEYGTISFKCIDINQAFNLCDKLSKLYITSDTFALKNITQITQFTSHGKKFIKIYVDV